MQLGMKSVSSFFTFDPWVPPLCIQSKLPLKSLPPKSVVLLDALLATWVSKQNKVEETFCMACLRDVLR